MLYYLHIFFSIHLVNCSYMQKLCAPLCFTNASNYFTMMSILRNVKYNSNFTIFIIIISNLIHSSITWCRFHICINVYGRTCIDRAIYEFYHLSSSNICNFCNNPKNRSNMPLNMHIYNSLSLRQVGTFKHITNSILRYYACRQSTNAEDVRCTGFPTNCPQGYKIGFG